MTNKQKIDTLVDLINKKLGNGTFYVESISRYGNWRIKRNHNTNKQITELEYYCIRRLSCSGKELIAFLEGLYYTLAFKN